MTLIEGQISVFPDSLKNFPFCQNFLNDSLFGSLKQASLNITDTQIPKHLEWRRI